MGEWGFWFKDFLCLSGTEQAAPRAVNNGTTGFNPWGSIFEERLMRQVVLMLFLLTLFFSIVKPTYADTVYFKDGRSLDNAETKETDNGIWINGVLFEKKLINKIETKVVIKAKTAETHKTLTEKATDVVKKVSNVIVQIQTETKAKDKSEARSSDINKQIKKRVEQEKERARLADQIAKQRFKESQKEEDQQEMPYSMPKTTSGYRY